MRKVILAACLTVALVGVSRTANAAPIGTNGCSFNGATYECDIYVDDDTGHSVLDMTASDPGWLVGYTFLLNTLADLSDGIQASDVAQALVFHSGLIELYSPVLGSSVFEGIINDALAGVAIDGIALANGQIIGSPVFNGSTQLNGVGYFFTEDLVTMLVAWGDPFFGGSDILHVHTGTAPSGPPTAVPEPGTLSLLGLGFACLAPFRRRLTGKSV